jgi:hypothetical protein
MYTGMTPVCGAASDALALWPLRHPADQICPTNRAMGTTPKLCTFTLLNWLLLFWKSFRIYPFIAVIIYPACRLSEVTSRGVTKIPSILNTKLLSKVPVLNREVFEKNKLYWSANNYNAYLLRQINLSHIHDKTENVIKTARKLK